ncbi:MAG: 50S ribosomal protein L11 methyltransferase [Oscillospiraceae bacterium]|nr:50S ribosomal protein L11 methyltransferase [Oscillospiraceae bacterium]
MKWIEAAVATKSEEIDAVCEQLAALGAGGMVVEDEADFQAFLENNHQYWDYVDDELESKFRGVSRVKFYLSDDDEGRALLETIRTGIGREITTAYVQDSDWENNWRQYYQPIEIGEKLVVVPEWLETPDDGRIPLRLDPGLIFGTGSHATTRMCLAALEHCAAPGKRVLDLGCGSGILGIGALLLGCDSVAGCDIDPKAPEVAEANAALNGLHADRFRVCAGDVLADAPMRASLGAGYDLVLANIVSDVIIPLSGIVGEFLAPDGVFLCSGIIEGRQDEVAAALRRNGFAILEHFNEEEWHCYVAKQK